VSIHPKGLSTLSECEKLSAHVDKGNSDLTVLFSIDNSSSEECLNNNNNNNNVPEGLPGWGIALIVVAAVLALAAIFVIVAMRNRRLRRVRIRSLLAWPRLIGTLL